MPKSRWEKVYVSVMYFLLAPPVCLNYESESGCKSGDKCRFWHVETDGQPSKNSKKTGAKGSVALFGLRVSRFSSEEIFSVQRMKIWIKSHRQILHGHVAPHKKFNKERVHREASFKSVNVTSAIRAPLSLRRGHNIKLCTKKDAPEEKHGNWRYVSTSSKNIKLRFSLQLKPGQRRRPPQNLQRNENSWLTPEHQCTC